MVEGCSLEPWYKTLTRNPNWTVLFNKDNKANIMVLSNIFYLMIGNSLQGYLLFLVFLLAISFAVPLSFLAYHTRCLVLCAWSVTLWSAIICFAVPAFLFILGGISFMYGFYRMIMYSHRMGYIKKNDIGMGHRVVRMW